MTHVTSRLIAKNRDQLRNPTLGNRVWVTFTFLLILQLLGRPRHLSGGSTLCTSAGGTALRPPSPPQHDLLYPPLLVCRDVRHIAWSISTFTDSCCKFFWGGFRYYTHTHTHTHAHTHARTHARTHTHTHTHTFNGPFFRDYPSGPVPES